ncbi:MAG: DNA internalization-related competence protein ComEC/Rec2, partial [Stenotrophomonas maltophilia]
MPTHLPIFGKACVVALLVGVCATVFAPRLLPVGWDVAALSIGLLLWTLPSRLRLLGAALFGLGWAAFHGHAGLAQQLPAGSAPVDHVVQGRVTSLPVHGPGGTRFGFRVDDDPAMPAELRG